MQLEPPDPILNEQANEEAIPNEQPNAASPGPDHGERRPTVPRMGRTWATLLVVLGALLGVALLWSVLSNRP